MKFRKSILIWILIFIILLVPIKYQHKDYTEYKAILYSITKVPYLIIDGQENKYPSDEQTEIKILGFSIYNNYVN